MIETAKVWSQASHCKRLQVGAVLAKDGRIISCGYNGTCPGDDNCCEDEEGNTLPTVSHAEANAIIFCARNGVETVNCTLYVTVSPCIECSKLIATAGIVRVVYIKKFRETSGIEFLQHRNIEVCQLQQQ